MTGVHAAPATEMPEVVLRRPEGFGGLELERLDGGMRATAPQVLGEHCLTLCTEGPASARYRGGVHALHDRRVRSYQAGEAFAAAPARGGAWSYRTLRLSPELLRDLARAAAVSLPAALPLLAADAGRDRLLLERLATTLAAFETPDAGADPEAELTALVRTLLERPARPPRRVTASERAQCAVARAQAFLREHRDEAVPLERLAGAVHMSKYHLNRTFRTLVGVTPHVFQTSLRIAEAKRRLRTPEPIAQIALSLGFSDQAHLTRTFRRYVGVPPGRYRNPERTIVQDGARAPT